MNNVIEFNHGMAWALMLAIAILEDDINNFDKLIKYDDGSQFTELHSSILHEIRVANNCLQKAYQILTSDDQAQIEREMLRDRLCAV